MRLSSASLKILIMSHRPAAFQTHEVERAISFPLHFPQLRVLDLYSESSFDQSTLRNLILTNPHLSILFINYGHQATRELLDREGQISSFETLILFHTMGDIPDESKLGFLKKKKKTSNQRRLHLVAMRCQSL